MRRHVPGGLPLPKGHLAQPGVGGQVDQRRAAVGGRGPTPRRSPPSRAAPARRAEGITTEARYYVHSDDLGATVDAVGTHASLARGVLNDSSGKELTTIPGAPMMPELMGGVANRGRVFRIGDTVHRPIAPAREATHAVLRHLRDVGFTAAPRVLDVSGSTEVLSWIPGRPGRLPLPDWAFTDEALVSVAVLVAGFHRAMAGFDPAELRWPQDAVPQHFRDGSIGHNDLHPGNLVFDGSTAVGLVDFDLAGPGGVAWDLATVARNWCPLQDDEDTPAHLRARRLERFDLLLSAYGADGHQRAEVSRCLLANHDWTYRIVTNAVHGGHRGFRYFWAGMAGRAGRERRWIADHLDGLARTAASARSAPVER